MATNDNRAMVARVATCLTGAEAVIAIELINEFVALAVAAERTRIIDGLQPLHAADCRLVRDGECFICDYIDKLRADA